MKNPYDFLFSLDQKRRVFKECLFFPNFFFIEMKVNGGRVCSKIYLLGSTEERKLYGFKMSKRQQNVNLWVNHFFNLGLGSC